MSTFINICCSMCGKELYRPLTVMERREKKAVRFPGFYAINDNGQEEICEKCYEVWKEAESENKE